MHVIVIAMLPPLQSGGESESCPVHLLVTGHGQGSDAASLLIMRNTVTCVQGTPVHCVYCHALNREAN